MRRALATAALLASLLPSAVLAQGGRGFLFDAPKVTVAFRAGYSIPRAEGELFDFTHEQFILNKWDFSSPMVGGELAVSLGDRWDLALSLGYTHSRSVSEYRNYIGTDGFPIEQETTFETVSATLGAKYYLTGRGRPIGRFAWVPRKWTPYFGFGGGVITYDFVQDGEFIDFSTFDIYFDTLRTSDDAALGYVSLGTDMALGSRGVLTGEARYQLASARVQGAYVGFENVDLGGLQLMLGLGFRL